MFRIRKGYFCCPQVSGWDGCAGESSGWPCRSARTRMPVLQHHLVWQEGSEDPRPCPNCPGTPWAPLKPDPGRTSLEIIENMRLPDSQVGQGKFWLRMRSTGLRQEKQKKLQGSLPFFTKLNGKSFGSDTADTGFSVSQEKDLDHWASERLGFLKESFSFL